MQVARTLASRPPEAGGLLRVLGLAFAIAVGVGTVIGGGILRTPAVVIDAVPIVGAAMALWVAVGVHSLIQANVVCELMTALPKAGGLFVPARAAFGEPGGLLVGWTDWLNYVAGIAALSIVSAEFLGMLVPAVGANIGVSSAAIAIALYTLNWLGVREGSHAQIIGSAAKGIFLLVVILLIFLAPPPDVAQAAETAARPITFAGIIIAYQIIFGAYSGWVNVAYFAEEDRDPGRNIPRGIYTTIISVTLLYALVTAAVSYALPIEALRTSKLAVADALAVSMGPMALKIVAGGAVLIALTCLNAIIMGAPRILYGLAEQRLFPRIAMSVNRGGTPSVALLLTAAASLLLALTGEFETVFMIMAALAMVPLVVADVALFKLRRDAPELHRPYRAKAYPWLPGLALILDLAVLVAFLTSNWTSGLFIVAAIAIALPIGLWMRRNQSPPIIIT